MVSLHPRQVLWHLPHIPHTMVELFDEEENVITAYQTFQKARQKSFHLRKSAYD